jgi:hypothetical protein
MHFLCLDAVHLGGFGRQLPTTLFINMQQIKLRYVIRKNRVSAGKVREYALTHDISLSEAKQLLVDESEPILQVWQQYDPFGNGTWQDIPTETQYNNKHD